MKSNNKSTQLLTNKAKSFVNHWSIKEELDNTALEIENPSIRKLIQDRIDEERRKGNIDEIAENIIGQKFIGDSQFTTFPNKSTNEKYTEAAIDEFKKQRAEGMKSNKEEYTNALEMLCASGVMSINDFIDVINGELCNCTAMHRLKSDMSSLNEGSKASKALGVKEHDIASINKAMTKEQIHAFNQVRQNTSQLIEYLNRVIRMDSKMNSDFRSLQDRIEYNARKFIKYAEEESFKYVYQTTAKAKVFNAEYPKYLQELKGSSKIKSDDIAISELHDKSTNAISGTYNLLNKTRELDKLGVKKFGHINKTGKAGKTDKTDKNNAHATNHALLIADLDSINRYITKQRLTLLQKSWEIDVNFDKILKYTVGIEILRDNLQQRHENLNKGSEKITQLAAETIEEYTAQIEELRQQNEQIIKDSTIIVEYLNAQYAKQTATIEEEARKIAETEFVKPSQPRLSALLNLTTNANKVGVANVNTNAAANVDTNQITNQINTENTENGANNPATATVTTENAADKQSSKIGTSQEIEAQLSGSSQAFKAEAQFKETEQVSFSLCGRKLSKNPISMCHK